MPEGRLELPSLSTHDFESCAYTNSATPAIEPEYQKNYTYGSLKQTFMKHKILVILGSTATGKSDLAVKIATHLRQGYGGRRKIKAEIISADSRQVYKGLDIGTGKITKKERRSIPHHMLDVVSPKKVFTVSDWQKQTKEIILSIINRGKLPIICGGTGFYIQSIVSGLILPEVPPNLNLRKKLEEKPVEELFLILKRLDPKRAKDIDRRNPVRLIRAIEIATALGSVPTPRQARGKSSYEFLQIGLTLPDKELKEKIYDRVIYRLKKGMIKEAENLHENGLSWKRMRTLGLEYRCLADYLEKKSLKTELLRQIDKEDRDYAKRQMTWFKRDKNIKWFKPSEIQKIEKEIHKFLDLKQL